MSGRRRVGAPVTLVIFRRSREMLRRGFTQSLRLIEEHDRPQRTFCQLKERARPWFAGWPKERGRLPDGIVQICFFWRRHGPLRQRQERRAHDRRNRPLRARVEFAHRFHAVTEQFNAHRASGFRREDINDAAAHGELPRQLHHFGSRVAHGTQVGN